MDFSFINIVNRVLAMTHQTTVSSLSSDNSDDDYRVQWCVNDVIADLSNMLRIKSRLTDFTFDTVAGQRAYNMPKRLICPFIRLRQKTDDIPLTYISAAEFDKFIPNDDSSGNPGFYYFDKYSGVSNQPASTGEAVYCVSDDGSDTSKCVIQGYDTNDRYIVEEVTLSGTSAVASVNTYKFIESISKLATSGTVTFRNSGSTTTFLVLNAKEKYARFLVIGLHDIPSSAITIYGRGYLEIPSMIHENEAPIGLSEKHINVIVAGAYAKYQVYKPDAKVETITEADNRYNSELAKVIAMDARNPDELPRMKSASERRIFSYFRPLDKTIPRY